VLPQVAERPAQAVERCPRLACTSSGAMGPALQQTLPQQIVFLFQQTQQEGIDQGHDQEQLAAGFPLLQAWRLHAQLTFAGAETGLDLPPASIREYHLPSRFLTVNGFIRQQIPWFTSASGHDEP
jgi:hypothetical protein